MPTHKKLRYLLTFVDTFSGWIKAFPTSRETADTVASILTQEIIPCFGLPVTIQSNNGPAFIAQLHIPYHPQSSGKVERAHGILKDHLTKLTIDVKLSWPTLLPLALAWIQATPWEPTGLSPFELLYGRPFLVSHNFLVQSPPLASYLPYLSLLRHLLREHANRALPVVLGPGDSRPAAPLQPGDSVLLQELQPGSLQPRWSGPHIVILTTPTAAKLLGHTLWYHVSCLKHLKATSGNPNPWAPPTFASPAAPACQFLMLQILILTILLMSPLKASPYYAWQFYLQESWTEGPTTKTQYLAQTDCQPAGCQSAIKLKFPKSKSHTIKNSRNNFGLCFLYNQTNKNCLKWNTTYGGCPYASCVMHKTFRTDTSPKSNMLSANNQDKVSLIIHNPWDDRWEKGTAGKIYSWFQSSHPSGTWLIYRSYTSSTILQNEAILTNQLKPPSNNSQPFSWLALVQQSINMLSLTEAINFTNCFLCASLNEPPLVPLRTGFNLSQSPMGPDTTLTGIPLFKAHSQNLSLCYGTADNSSCNTTVKVKSTHYAPPGGYFWCNETLTKVINAFLPLPCVPVTLVPQLKVYGQAEFQSLLTPPPPLVCQNKQPSSSPLSLASSLVAAGIGSGAIGYSVTSAAQLEDKLRVAIEASAASLASLWRQITSLAQVTLQNRRALDLLTAEKGGTCMFLQEECCYYINESGLVEENINTLHRRPLQKAKYRSFISKLVASYAWLTPVITPIIVPTNSYARNWMSGRQPNAASSLRPALS
ncbi:LOW QUALITY PROTEIN: Endogenous retrovirus group FC1 Env polyprotein [Plecturocebus cupreus]